MPSLAYENLGYETRQLMVAEITSDIADGRVDAARGLYVSSYLNDAGVAAWPDLLLAAAQTGDDYTLARELSRLRCFKYETQRRKPKGGYTVVRVPVTAAETLSESQFNMYYMRALAIRAIELGVSLIVYRAKSVERPRETSEQMIGKEIDPRQVLDALRETRGVNPPIHIPLPNTGITVRLGSIQSALGIRLVS